MVDTALTLITDALLDLGVLADEEQPAASQASGALRKLNNMIDAWNIDGLLVYGSTQYVLPLVGNQQVYTIGTGGDLNVPRPTNITSAFLRQTSLALYNQADLPLYIFNNQEWADVRFKGMTSSYPYGGVWFDETFPYINAYVFPIPTGNQYSLVFWADGVIGNLAINTPINLAPGYKRALTANLCLELAPSYQTQVPDELRLIATSSKNAISRENLQINELYTGPRGRYDIRSNTFLPNRYN